MSGQSPEASHCNNIGPLQRQGIYAALKKWFNIAPPDKEPKERHSAAELTCLTPALARGLKSQPLHMLAATLGDERAAKARQALAGQEPAQRRRQLQRTWSKLLGPVDPPAALHVSISSDGESVGEVTINRLSLKAEPGIVVPLLLLLPPRKGNARAPVVVALAHGGKQAFLKNESAVLAGLLQAGVAVCLPDVRGTGEKRPGDGRGRGSAATAHASSEGMLGQTLVGARLRDLRAVLNYLRGRDDVDAHRLALWGESFAPVNPPERDVAIPHEVEPTPDLAEPLGGLLALFARSSRRTSAPCASMAV